MDKDEFMKKVNDRLRVIESDQVPAWVDLSAAVEDYKKAESKLIIQ